MELRFIIDWPALEWQYVTNMTDNNEFSIMECELHILLLLTVLCSVLLIILEDWSDFKFYKTLLKSLKLWHKSHLFQIYSQIGVITWEHRCDESYVLVLDGMLRTGVENKQRYLTNAFFEFTHNLSNMIFIHYRQNILLRSSDIKLYRDKLFSLIH